MGYLLPYCYDESEVPIEETTELPPSNPSTPESETTVDVLNYQRRGYLNDIERHAIAHKVWALPEKTGEANKFEITGYVSSIDITEEIKKDTDVKISVNNQDFILNDLVFFGEGHRIKIELFDGVDWEDFGSFIIVTPSRSYGDIGAIELNCRSEMVKLQRGTRSFVWHNKRISQAVEDVARQAGFTYDIDDTAEAEHTLEGTSITMANEAPITFIKRMADKVGYEYFMKDGILNFKKPGADKTDVVLKYRPEWPYIGSIIKAGVTVDGASNKKGKPKVYSVDFKAGTIGENVLEAIQASSLGEVAEALRPVPEDQIRQLNEYQNQVLKDLEADITEMDDPFKDEGNVLPDDFDYVVPMYNLHSTPEDARRIIAQITNSNAYKYQLDLETYGMANLRPCTIITVEGLGVQDSGQWLIVKASRKFTNSGYLISLTCKRHVKPKPKQKPPGAADAQSATTNDTESPGGQSKPAKMVRLGYGTGLEGA